MPERKAGQSGRPDPVLWGWNTARACVGAAVRKDCGTA